MPCIIQIFTCCVDKNRMLTAHLENDSAPPPERDVKPVSVFTSPQVCDLIGITYRQLDYWVRTRVIVPSVNESDGSGNPRLFSFTDVLVMHIIKEFVRSGIALQIGRTLAELLKSIVDSFSDERAYLITVEGDVVKLSEANARLQHDGHTGVQVGLLVRPQLLREEIQLKIC